jgi:SAM-dependent methyltransferase
MQCILCENKGITVSDTIQVQDLFHLYKKRTGIDVRRFFTRDTISMCTCSNCGLKFYYPQAIGDGAFYDELQSYNSYYLPGKTEFTQAARHIKNTQDVLEVGCGDGSFSTYIRYKSYTGLEFSKVAIGKARDRGLSVFHQSLQEHAASNAGRYDVVCFFQLLEHIANPGRFIRDIFRCLKENGLLILAVPDNGSFIRHAVNFYLNMPPHHASCWSEKTLLKVASLHSLQTMEIFHEKLHRAHRLFYLKTIINHRLRKVFGLRYKPVDNSAGSTIIYHIAAFVAYLVNPFFNGNQQRGQSVLAVYRKRTTHAPSPRNKGELLAAGDG